MIFDAVNKIIQLESLHSSAELIWSAMVDWAALSDNLNYGVGVTQVGGVAPVALYIYLELGWLVRPMEADGITTITGNLLVTGGGSPIAPTIGNWNVLVNMETPVSAVSINATDLSTVATASNLNIVNNNIKKSSLMIPATEDLL